MKVTFLYDFDLIMSQTASESVTRMRETKGSGPKVISLL